VANDPVPLQFIPNGRRRQDDSVNKHQTVEIEVAHVGQDLQFRSASVGPPAASLADEKQSV
jgi:hypothetical protein